MSERGPRPSAVTDAALAEVALWYYKDGLTQDQIAKRLRVSRATIVNYLREGRDRGIVEIRVQGEAFSRAHLSQALCDRFGLVDAYVADAMADEPLAEVTRRTARVAGMALHSILEPGQLLGLSWGGTVRQIADETPARIIPGLAVCQIVGSFHTEQLSAAESCTVELARRIGETCYTLHAPAVLSSADLAEQLRREPAIRDQLDRLQRLDAVLFGIGDCSPDTLMVSGGMASAEVLDGAVAQGAVGVLCGRFIGIDGRQIATEIDDRIIGMEIDRLARTTTRIFTAAGPGKRDAALAVLTGGYASHLIVDSGLAEALLDATGKDVQE